jgi:hypothetical protein
MRAQIHTEHYRMKIRSAACETTDLELNMRLRQSLALPVLLKSSFKAGEKWNTETLNYQTKRFTEESSGKDIFVYNFMQFNIFLYFRVAGSVG